MRLNVFLQKSGVGSRREAERLVADGRVTINGLVANATMPVEENDLVEVDGKVLSLDQKPLPRLYRLNKPVGVIVTHRDHEGRRTVFEMEALRKAKLPRLMNVGRLDVNSEGLLLFSSDGPLAQALMSPDNGLKRHYRVRVYGRLKPEQIIQLARGVTVDGVSYRGVEVNEEAGHQQGRNQWYRVVLTEGKNREIRKLMEHFDCVVNRLIRVQYGPFELGTLKSGALEEIAPTKVRDIMVKLLPETGAKAGGGP